METKEIQQLIDFISQSGLDEVNIETSALKLKVKRSSAPVIAAAPVVAAPAPVAPVATAPAPTAAAPAAPAAEASNLITIKSPMIGTFYSASSPESPAYVTVGDVVKPGKVVCVVEAMKLFNEIESEVSGKIVKILVDNASPVEFDQPLFLVEPA